MLDSTPLLNVHQTFDLSICVPNLAKFFADCRVTPIPKGFAESASPGCNWALLNFWALSGFNVTKT
jgi:hypothetical protein